MGVGGSGFGFLPNRALIQALRRFMLEWPSVTTGVRRTAEPSASCFACRMIDGNNSVIAQTIQSTRLGDFDPV
jgi:hypothetical protein